MEKTGEIRPGVTPEVKETEKRACGCGCRCKTARPIKEAVQQLEDEVVSRLADKAAGK